MSGLVAAFTIATPAASADTVLKVKYLVNGNTFLKAPTPPSPSAQAR